MTADEAVERIDTLLSHVWMVRTFIKHSEEAEEDDELREVHRALYDYALALGGPKRTNDSAAYLKQATKKLSKLRKATDLFLGIQPDISGHTNFQMAVQSLDVAVKEITSIIQEMR